jgi:hypothetical protein
MLQKIRRLYKKENPNTSINVRRPGLMLGFSHSACHLGATQIGLDNHPAEDHFRWDS